MLSFDRPSLRLSQICILSLVSIMLSGCALGTFQSPDSMSDPTYVPAYTLSGTIHTPPPASPGAKVRPHVSFPAAGATVYLYAAGTSGYGSPATLLAQTITATDGSGSFSFTQSSAHTNSYNSISSTYSCPSYTFNSPDGTTHITKDAYIYIVAFGGDTQNNFDATSTQSNTGYALMAALGDCANAGSLFVNVNEVTTVASVFALAPYISPVYPTANINSVSTTLVGGALGTSTSYMTAYGTGLNGGYTATGANKSAAVSPLGYTGMVNAFATVNNLVNLASGTANATVSNTATVGGQSVTLTGTIEQAKINQLADILAYCVDSSNSGSSTVSSQCSSVFTYAKPPIAWSTTSLSGTSSPATPPAATDTLQAAWNIATNPTNNTSYGAATTGTSSNLYNLYSLVSGTADYQPTLSSQPSDWTLSIAYSSTNTCGTDTLNAASYFTGPSLWTANSDLSGNITFLNGTSNYGTIGQISSTGTPTLCQKGNGFLLRSLTTDIADNLWFAASGESFNTGTGTQNYGGIYKTSSSTSAPVFWKAYDGTAYYIPYAVTADGSGNIFYSEISSCVTTTPYTCTTNTEIQEFPAAYNETYTSSVQSARIAGYNSTTSYNFYFLAADTAGNIWTNSDNLVGDQFVFFNSSGTFTEKEFSGQTSVYTPYGSAFDSSGNFYSGNTCCDSGSVPATYFLKSTVTGTGSSATDSVTNNGTFGAAGLLGARSVAVDGAGNVWASSVMAASSYTSTATSPTCGTASGTCGVYSIAEVNSALSPMSPNANITGLPSSCLSTTQDTTCNLGGGYQKATLFPSRGINVDISGNVWVPGDGASTTANSLTNSFLTEIVGAAVPTVQPQSIAARDSKFGTKP